MFILTLIRILILICILILILIAKRILKERFCATFELQESLDFGGETVDSLPKFGLVPLRRGIQNFGGESLTLAGNFGRDS